VSEHGGFHSGSAHFVDGNGTCGGGKAGFEHRLARGRLALASGKDAAHENFLDSIGRDGGAPNGGMNCGGAELMSGEIFEVAEKATDGGAGRAGEDDGVG
jgi:hypothetical protein